MIFRALWILCRHRHKIHYAEFRIMPTNAPKLAWEALISVKDAA
jgi:hypothetical protein